MPWLAPRRIAAAAGFVLLLVVLLAGMRELAARITAAHLLHVADRQLGLLERGQPLWQWRLRQPHDLVASRAFGHASVRSDHDGLKVTSHDGTPIELGLPVGYMLDAGHWPMLLVQGHAEAPFKLGVVWRPRLKEPGCAAWQSTPVAAGPVRLSIDLRVMPWKAENGGPCEAPELIQMLRLQLQLPAGQFIHLDTVALGQAAPLVLPNQPSLRLSPDVSIAARQLADTSLPATPWVELPAGLSAEAQLALRQIVWRYRPGALIVPHGSVLVASSKSRWVTWLPWPLTLLYLLALALLTAKPPRQPLRRWLEIVGCMIGPLWLITGLELGLRLSLPSLLAFAGAVLFAMQAEWRQRPVPWRWLGDWHAWLAPLALVPVALLLIAICGHGFRPPLVGHMLTYLLWAIVQQWLMLAVVLRRLEAGLRQPVWVVLIVASLFALMHTPNGALMQLCLLAEVWWAWCFVRSRALLPVAFAHAVCALLVEAGLTGGLLRSLEVSARFFL